jgi:hypothetical protein
MIERITYKGPLVIDTTIAGERKCDGILPAHPGILQASRNRFILFFATLDPDGCDAVKSILYQVRAGAPDGAVLKEGVVAASQENWDPLQRGDAFSKRCGMPVAFGVPKGAKLGGRGAGHANHFVVKWYRYAHWRKNGKLLNPTSGPVGEEWPDHEAVRRDTLRVEWMQFRLNDAEDGIEVLEGPQTMRETGYETDAEFCSLGPGCHMNHAMVPPVPVDERCEEWVEFDTFASADARSGHGHGRVAPVRYRFNARTRRYEWVQTGKLLRVPGAGIGESSTVHSAGQEWIVAFRSWNSGFWTHWFRTDDPFGPLGEPTRTEPNLSTPRHVYRCADGAMRIFTNEDNGRIRDPLLCWSVDPKRFALTDRRVIADAREAHLPFASPRMDMSKLCPNQGARQLVVFRAITGKQTWFAGRGPSPVRAEEHERAGVHHAEILYREPVADPWDLE